MELSQLRAFLALKELSSLSKAAEHLHLSTPAVFSQIRQLEDQLGVKLYERVGRRLELTPAGRLLAEHARRILQAHDDAVAQLKGQGEGPREVLRLGCGPHSGLRIAPHLLRAFLCEHPKSDVRLTTGDDQSLLRELRSGLLDAVLLSLPVNDPEFHEVPLWRYEMVFVVPERGKVEWNSVRRVSDLAPRPFLLYRRPVVVTEAVRLLFAAGGFEPQVVMENDDPDSIRELVKLGIGYAILPLWTVAEDRRRGALRVMRAKQRSIHCYGVLHRKTGYRPLILAGLLKVAQQWPHWWPLARYVSPAPHAV